MHHVGKNRQGMHFDWSYTHLKKQNIGNPFLYCHLFRLYIKTSFFGQICKVLVGSFEA